MKLFLLLGGVLAADGPSALSENFICGTVDRIE
jgi:hypothetical protein